jgi:hypothetical protein
MLLATGTKHQWTGENGRTLHYSERTEDGRYWARNMRWSVRNAAGVEIYRGPAWRARMIAECLDTISFGEAMMAADRL